MWTCIKLIMLNNDVHHYEFECTVVYAIVSSREVRAWRVEVSRTVLLIPRLLLVSQSVHGSAVLRTHF